MKAFLALALFALVAPQTSQAFGPKPPSDQADKLCGDFEGTIRIPEIPVKLTGAQGEPITPPAYATVWVYDGDHSTLSIPDDVPILLPFAYGKFKPVPLPLRVNAAGDGYLVGPMDLELKKKLAGFAGTRGTCRQYVWRMTLTANPSPWSCSSKACQNRDNPNPDFFLGPNGPLPFKGLPQLTSGLAAYRADLAGSELTLLEDASPFGQSFGDYLKKTTKVAANLRAKLDELASKSFSAGLRKSDSVSGRALWDEVDGRFEPGIESTEGEGAFYDFFARQVVGPNVADLYLRCLKFAAQVNRPATAYGQIDSKWPKWSFDGFHPGDFYVSGIDADTWAFCQDKLKAGTEPNWSELAPQAPGVASFVKLANSRAQGADVRRMNISGTFQIKLMTSPLEQDPARGVAVQTILSPGSDPVWEPIVAGFSKEDMDCLIEKATSGGTADLSAFQANDRAAGLKYLKLVRLESVCFKRR